jgi:hypothetical protein
MSNSQTKKPQLAKSTFNMKDLIKDHKQKLPSYLYGNIVKNTDIKNKSNQYINYSGFGLNEQKR